MIELAVLDHFGCVVKNAYLISAKGQIFSRNSYFLTKCCLLSTTPYKIVFFDGLLNCCVPGVNVLENHLPNQFIIMENRDNTVAYI